MNLATHWTLTGHGTGTNEPGAWSNVDLSTAKHYPRIVLRMALKAKPEQPAIGTAKGSESAGKYSQRL